MFVEKNPLSEHQQGFRRYRSTEGVISNTTNCLEKFRTKYDPCLAVFFDIAAAFGTIKPHHIREQLFLNIVDASIVYWYYNYIT